MTTLQYEDSGYRKKKEEEERDKFAIGFGEYLDSLTYQDMGEFTIKELLEIYKKEN